MKAYTIITSYDNRFKHTEDTIFFATDKHNVDELVALAMSEINDRILYVSQEYDQYSTLEQLLVEEYDGSLQELQVVATIDGVDFYN